MGNDTFSCDENCWLSKIPWPHAEPEPVLPQRNIAIEAASISEACKRLYGPLRPWQTRVLRLKAGSFDQLVLCDLLVVDIILYEGVLVHGTDERLSYSALSYTWGGPIFIETAEVNQVTLPITANLAAALRYLRKPDQGIMLWVDAICINQQDDDEKAFQVRNMFDIYRKAADVICWLGTPTADMGPTFAIAEALCESAHPTRSIKGHRSDCRLGVLAFEEGMRQIFAVSWFRRTWIRQEVFCAQNLEVAFGNRRLPWKWLRRTTREFLEFQLIHKGRGGYRSKLNTKLPHLPEFFEGAGDGQLDTLDLMTTLATAVHFGEANPRDKVYAILGMTATTTIDDDTKRRKARPANILNVDYSRTVSEVYQDITKYLINDQQNSSVLLLQPFPDPSRDPSLPSWTPDWRTEQPQKNIRFSSRHGGCSLWTPPGEVFPCQDMGETNILRLRGQSLYRVETLSYAERYSEWPDLFREYNYNTKDWAEADLSVHHRPSSEVSACAIVPSKSQSGDSVVHLSDGWSFVFRPNPDRTHRYVGMILPWAYSNGRKGREGRKGRTCCTNNTDEWDQVLGTTQFVDFLIT